MAPMAALDDLPRPGKEPTNTAEAKAWVIDLACHKAKELGFPHELWTTRLLACHAREHGHKGANDRFQIVAVGALPTECCASRYSGSKRNKRL
jgi:hypothetical protein